MGCCRSSIIFDPNNSLYRVMTTEEYKTPEKVRNSIKIEVREKMTVKNDHLYTYYEIGDLIGEGAFGCVRKGIQISTGIEVAIKSILKTFAQRSDDSNAIIEVEILRSLDHPNILKIIDIVEDSRNYHIVTEMCYGGELFEKILKLKPFSESTAASYMNQLLSALAFCHKHGVLHRDIKPENLLLQSDAMDSPIKIIDFGVSNLNYGTMMINVKQFTSAFYKAPEQYQGMCNEKSDLWSCGVIMYLMLCGYLPFKGKNEKQIFASINTDDLNFPDREWACISDSAKDLLRHMLNKDQVQRCSAREAFMHPWTQNGHSQFLLNCTVSETGLKNLFKFRSSLKIRHAALEFIMSHFTHSKEIYKLQQAFIAMDINGDGKLTKEELKIACTLVNYTKHEVQSILDECDANINGYLDYTEFLTAATNWKLIMSKAKLRAVFDAFDTNKDGFISVVELKEMLSNNHPVDESVWDKILQEVDVNKDGKIDLEEFEEAVLIKDTFR